MAYSAGAARVFAIGFRSGSILSRPVLAVLVRNHPYSVNRLCRKMSRRRAPYATPPEVAGNRLERWPERVAVIAFGIHKVYEPRVIEMWDERSSRMMKVDGPRALASWGERNGARIPTCRSSRSSNWSSLFVVAHALVLRSVSALPFADSLGIVVHISCRHRPMHELWQLRVATWDLLSWLPFDPSEHLGDHRGRTGLDGVDCWRSVFQDKFFFKLVRAIADVPADLVMS